MSWVEIFCKIDLRGATSIRELRVLIIHIDSKDTVKCMLNVNQDTKHMRRQERLILWLAKGILLI